MCCNEYNDNRDSCGKVLPSSCVPYTGYIGDSIKDSFKCKPNINDLFKKLQDLIDEIKKSLGDNSELDLNCIKDDLNKDFSQQELNQAVLNKLCELENSINNNTLDVSTAKIVISLLCLEDPSCDTKSSYTVRELFTKLISAYCDLLTRVRNIETILNI